MSGGRCAGCGMTDSSCKKVRNHTLNCPDFIALWRENPDAALDPAIELERYKLTDEGDVKQKEKDARRAKMREATTARHQSQMQRWDKKGLLAEPSPASPTPVEDSAPEGSDALIE